MEPSSTNHLRPRVPYWIRVPAIHIGRHWPFHALGNALYQKYLEKTVGRLMNEIPLEEIYLRGRKAPGNFQPGLSDLDLILVGKNLSRDEEVNAIRRAKQLQQELTNGLSPLGEMGWINLAQKQRLLRQSIRHRAAFGGMRYHDGCWRQESVDYFPASPHFEQAFEKYYEAFWLIQFGIQTKQPITLYLAHACKSLSKALQILCDMGLGSEVRVSPQPRAPSWEGLAALVVQCLSELDHAAQKIGLVESGEPGEEIHRETAFLDTEGFLWEKAQRNHLLKVYRQRSGLLKHIGFEERFPLCFSFSGAPTAEAITFFLKTIIEEARALSNPIVFPLFNQRLAAIFCTLIQKRSQNRRYLFGHRSEPIFMPRDEWNVAIWEWLFQLTTVIMSGTPANVKEAQGFARRALVIIGQAAAPENNPIIVELLERQDLLARLTLGPLT